MGQNEKKHYVLFKKKKNFAAFTCSGISYFIKKNAKITLKKHPSVSHNHSNQGSQILPKFVFTVTGPPAIGK